MQCARQLCTSCANCNCTQCESTSRLAWNRGIGMITAKIDTAHRHTATRKQHTMPKATKMWVLALASVLLVCVLKNVLAKTLPYAMPVCSVESAAQHCINSGVTLAKQSSDNATHSIQCGSTSRRRAKRVIIFDRAGVVKLVIGVAYPIELQIKMGTLLYFYNIQLQYVPPPIPIYWWSIYNTSTFAARKQFHSHAMDTSRDLLYRGIAALFSRYKVPGMACLLRTICEVAGTEFDTGIGGPYKVLHELLNVIFLPQRFSIEEKYREAYQAGRSGASCLELYSDCPRHNFWLDKLTVKF